MDEVLDQPRNFSRSNEEPRHIPQRLRMCLATAIASGIIRLLRRWTTYSTNRGISAYPSKAEHVRGYNNREWHNQAAAQVEDLHDQPRSISITVDD